MEALEDGNVARISALLSIHNKVLQAQFSAEKLYREDQERRRVLITLIAYLRSYPQSSHSLSINRLVPIHPRLAYLSRIENITSSRLFSLIFRDIRPVSSIVSQ